MTKKLSKGLRKFIRQQKARIRREVLDVKEQERLIQKLHRQFFKEPSEIKEKSPQKAD